MLEGEESNSPLGLGENPRRACFIQIAFGDAAPLPFQASAGVCGTCLKLSHLEKVSVESTIVFKFNSLRVHSLYQRLKENQEGRHYGVCL